MTVDGPLIVVSERVGDAPPRRGDEVETRRVFLYDVAEDRYWAAFDYENPRTLNGLGGQANRSAVHPAGTSIIVWSGDQVRRMGLDGETQAVLFEDETIRAIRVSPDGSKVAVMHGEPGTLLVLDARDGAEVLGVASDDPDLGTLQGGGRFGMLNLGDWRDDSEAVSVTVGDHSGKRAHTAVLLLDGGIRVLAEGIIVSPHLRYAIQPGEVIGLRSHDHLWESLAVLDMDTGRVVWTIAGQLPDRRGRVGVQRLDVGTIFSPAWDHLDHSGLWLGAYAAFSDGGGWVLDTETGEIMSLTPDIERRIEGPVRSTCGIDDDYPWHRPYACYVQHDDRVVWEGAVGWTRYLGLIEVPGSLELRGVEPVVVAREVLLSRPHERSEIVGPLLAYEVHGEYEYRAGEGRPDARARRRVIVYDEGAGRSWLAFAYQNWFAHGYARRGAAQPALGGFVAETDLQITYSAVDGQSRALSEYWGPEFHVSPDGRKLALRSYGGNDGSGYVPAHVAVLDIASGEEIVRYADADLPAALDLSLSHEGYSWSVYADGWTSDSATILLRLNETDELGDGPVYRVLAGLDGEVHLGPCVTDEHSWAHVGLSCLSPDARYYVSGAAIIDFRTSQVIRTAETDALMHEDQWEWASADKVAWASGGWPRLFGLERQRLEATRAEVSVLDVTTGEVEVMDSAEYLARFHPPPRATTECPPHPAQACRILLDGEVIGEGRWPRIIGFIELD